MTVDPFEILREPLTPLAPRPEFAAQLRRRLTDLLVPPPTQEVVPVPETYEYTPARFHTMTPYLCCADSLGAIEWYQEVFGAVLLGPPIMMGDGVVGHSELRIGNSVFMLAGEYPPEGVESPLEHGGNSVSLMIYVSDSDAVFQQALARGATEVRSMRDDHGDHVGVLRDPFGHRWFIATHLVPDDAPVSDVPGRRIGDIGYVTLQVPSGQKARDFYGALFGWRAEAGHEPDSFHISSITPPSGIHGQQPAADVRLFFRVDDLAAATARVRELGGEVLSVADYESGGNAECVDDQGLRFDLFRPRPGY